MKKFSVVLIAAVLAIFLVAGSASATLLGIKNYFPTYPDIKYDNQGRLKYDTGNNLFTIWNSVDEQIKLSAGGTPTVMTDETYYSFVTGFGLAIHVDQNGDLTSGVTGYTYSWDLNNIVNNTKYTFSDTYSSDWDMVEVLLKGSITIGGNMYDTTNGPVLLLAGEVAAFGWDEGNVDFLFDPIAGKLIDDGIWPNGLPTGAFAAAGSNGIDWSKNFDLENKGGDKAPVPEPATMLLFGVGLIGLAGLGRKKFFVKG